MLPAGMWSTYNISHMRNYYYKYFIHSSGSSKIELTVL